MYGFLILFLLSSSLEVFVFAGNWPCRHPSSRCKIECGRREVSVSCPTKTCCPPGYRCCIRSPNDVFEPIRTPRRTPNIAAFNQISDIKRNWTIKKAAPIEDEMRILTNSADSLHELGQRASKYCKKYSKLAMKEILLNPLTAKLNPVRLEVEACPPRINPLVVGGSIVLPGEFPHMAALGFKRGELLDFLCGGTLVSERMVLTAAHCTETKWGKPSVVHLGSMELNSNKGQLVEVLDCIVHPNYKPPAVYYDIALVKLTKDIELGAKLRPACLPTPLTAAQVPGAVAVATGWGKLGFGRESSNWLMKVSLKVVGNHKCQRFYGVGTNSLPIGITSSLLCADGVSSPAADTCQGDSGGPLQAKGPHRCTVQVIGITSFGKSCGTGIPGVYTRVTSYLSWLEDILWPHG